MVPSLFGALRSPTFFITICVLCVISPLQSDSDDVPLVRRKPAPAKAAESDEDKPLKKAMPKKAVKAEDSDDEPLSARRAKPEPPSDTDGDDFEDEKPAKKVRCLLFLLWFVRQFF